ncbi:hypothetical protein G7Y89_g13423 [Cudoniella acicularis]|uniref:Uncharacterized protein n=1 Tax=Cudoniella acicularis TaxID=354080 RepID=A0A8H4VY96_9HELO|nr:hypothetical protein G7Y89_g13423 [Cudoniella acicularis]
MFVYDKVEFVKFAKLAAVVAEEPKRLTFDASLSTIALTFDLPLLTLTRLNPPCDEEKPVCGNCLRHFLDVRNCEYEPVRSKDQSSGSSEEVRINECPSYLKLENLIPRGLDGEKLDPFITYPQSNVSGIDVLMKYHLQQGVYQSFPWQPAYETNTTAIYYIPLVWSDPVLFHATLHFSAKKLSGQQLQAFQVNSGISDETISAVATLAGIEHENGNLKMLRMHINGLKRMIELRGGLDAIRQTNPMVANTVFWIFTVAIYEIPYLNFDPTLPLFTPSEYNLSFSPTTTPTSHSNDCGPKYNNSGVREGLISLGLDHNIASIVVSIQRISQLVPSNSAYPTASTSLTILTRMCTISHLLSLPPLVPSENEGERAGNQTAALSETTRLATLLHVLTPWRGLPPDGVLNINLLLHKLVGSLQTLFSAPNYENNFLILWIFATGAVAAKGLPERSWFVL